MLPALRLALAGERDAGRLRQVVFLTDGAVSNERKLLGEIQGRLNSSRLFTIGIGSAPNSYFMRKAAEAGRGSFTYIGKLSEVARRMDGLFRKLERPALTDLLSRWSLAAGDVSGIHAYPKLLPDLYHGEPVVMAVKLPGAAASDPKDELHITGILGGRQWRHRLALSTARTAQGISALWARARITDLMDSLRQGADPAVVRKSVIETALRHNLVSRYTSLVAISKKVARPEDAPLTSRKLPLNLPHGWNYDKVFGEIRAKPAPASARHAGLRTAGAVASVDAGMSKGIIAGAPPVQLPQGATPAMLNIWIGLLALMAAAGFMLWRRARA